MYESKALAESGIDRAETDNRCLRKFGVGLFLSIVFRGSRQQNSVSSGKVKKEQEKNLEFVKILKRPECSKMPAFDQHILSVQYHK